MDCMLARRKSEAGPTQDQFETSLTSLYGGAWRSTRQDRSDGDGAVEMSEIGDAKKAMEGAVSSGGRIRKPAL